MNASENRRWALVGPLSVALWVVGIILINKNGPADHDDFKLQPGHWMTVDANGTKIGKFGRAGKLPKEFGTLNAIDCRDENTLYVGEIGNLRVQKLTLH